MSYMKIVQCLFVLLFKYIHSVSANSLNVIRLNLQYYSSNDTFIVIIIDISFAPSIFCLIVIVVYYFWM